MWQTRLLIPTLLLSLTQRIRRIPPLLQAPQLLRHRLQLTMPNMLLKMEALWATHTTRKPTKPALQFLYTHQLPVLYSMDCTTLTQASLIKLWGQEHKLQHALASRQPKPILVLTALVHPIVIIVYLRPQLMYTPHITTLVPVAHLTLTVPTTKRSNARRFPRET